MKRDQVDQVLEQWEEERPDLDVSSLEIGSRILRLSKHIRNSVKDALAPFRLDPWGFDVLAALRREGEPFAMSPTELRRATILSSGAMTNRIDRLEHQGLVERVPDPDDRRGVKVRLTSVGQQLIDEAVVSRLEAADQLISHLTAQEQRTLADLLRKLLLIIPLERERRQVPHAN
ncbi:MAG: MarR family transcriptional regulator [Gemmatimonadales bacterium]|nr:MarR family transcriptional regulator [Gemmatimonadales bacterium]